MDTPQTLACPAEWEDCCHHYEVLRRRGRRLGLLLLLVLLLPLLLVVSLSPGPRPRQVWLPMFANPRTSTSMVIGGSPSPSTRAPSTVASHVGAVVRLLLPTATFVLCSRPEPGLVASDRVESATQHYDHKSSTCYWYSKCSYQRRCCCYYCYCCSSTPTAIVATIVATAAATSATMTTIAATTPTAALDRSGTRLFAPIGVFVKT